MWTSIEMEIARYGGDKTPSSTFAEAAQLKSVGRSWIPPIDRMPPIVQFVLRVAEWCKGKWTPAAKPATQLRLIGQLALGAKRHVSVVEVNGLQFLVGGGAEHVTVIVPLQPVSVPGSSVPAGTELLP